MYGRQTIGQLYKEGLKNPFLSLFSHKLQTQTHTHTDTQTDK